MQTIDEALQKLNKSDFRRRFHLSTKDREYISKKGLAAIEKDAAYFIETRLAPAHPKNDGKQTPMRGHPVFVAQHATACCCRGCLQKWYKVPKNKKLSLVQQQKIVNLLMAWIEKELE